MTAYDPFERGYKVLRGNTALLNVEIDGYSFDTSNSLFIQNNTDGYIIPGVI
jgi:hypothetical protein